MRAVWLGGTPRPAVGCVVWLAVGRTLRVSRFMHAEPTMKISMKSATLVCAQAAAMVYIAASGPWVAHWLPLRVAELAGIGLGAWAVAAMGLRRLRVVPELADGARLVTAGPYRFVRHPMYTAVLLIALALTLDRLTVPRAAAWIGLLAVLAVKLRYEESLLRARFPEYEAYCRRTSRLVPGVF